MTGHNLRRQGVLPNSGPNCKFRSREGATAAHKPRFPPLAASSIRHRPHPPRHFRKFRSRERRERDSASGTGGSAPSGCRRSFRNFQSKNRTATSVSIRRLRDRSPHPAAHGRIRESDPPRQQNKSAPPEHCDQRPEHCDRTQQPETRIQQPAPECSDRHPNATTNTRTQRPETRIQRPAPEHSGHPGISAGTGILQKESRTDAGDRKRDRSGSVHPRFPETETSPATGREAGLPLPTGTAPLRKYSRDPLERLPSDRKTGSAADKTKVDVSKNKYNEILLSLKKNRAIP